VPVGKVVAAISLAVIEIGYSRNDDLLGACAFADEELAISLACDAENSVCITEAGGRCTRQPARKESETLDEVKQDGFSVRNPLLNQHYLMVSNVLLHVHVRTGNCKVVRPSLPLVVDGKVMILQIRPASPGQLVTYDSELHQPESSKNLVKTIAVVGREGVLILRKVLGYLMHLGCLIHRTTYEEDSLSHSHFLVAVPMGALVATIIFPSA
jgi:hypothetical protein